MKKTANGSLCTSARFSLLMERTNTRLDLTSGIRSCASRKRALSEDVYQTRNDAFQLPAQMLRIMKLLSFFIFIATLSVYAGGSAQNVTISGKDLSFPQIFTAIEKQTGYVVFRNKHDLAALKPVTLAVYEMPIKELLDIILHEQPLKYIIKDRTIVLSRKSKATHLPELPSTAPLQLASITGRVIDSLGNPIEGASIKILNTKNGASSAADGTFSILNIAAGTYTIEISLVGHLSIRRKINVAENAAFTLKDIVLTMRAETMNDVVVNVSTGYQQLPKERATGAFTLIDNKLFNRSTGGNVLSRLEGITNGLVFDRNNLVGENIGGQPEIRVRGLSTILGNTNPLIIIDNFPYEGDINAINPNDVENITLLRDAAAASIWGARAGNGVIVINTKTGKYNMAPQISVNSNLTVTEKPDLFYSRNYLPAANVMEIQKELFEARTFNPGNLEHLPSYIELLYKKRDGVISDEEFNAQEAWYRQTDNRKDWSKYLYQQAITQQHSLNIRGGGNNNWYAFSVGYDKERDMYVGNENNRLNLNLQNTFRITPELEFTGSVFFTRQQSQNNAILSSVTTPFTGISPDIYEALVDAQGNPLPISIQTFRTRYYEEAPTLLPALKLQDWMYRPLEEINRSNTLMNQNDFRVNGGLKYRFLQHFSTDLTYQFTSSFQETESIHSKESFYVRNLVNSFTQPNGTRIIPLGGILNYSSPQNRQSHSGRALLHYTQRYSADHEVTALAGAEIRQTIASARLGHTLYNYDPEVMTATTTYDYNTFYAQLPFDFARIPTNMSHTFSAPSKTTNRDLSYFSNGSYTYKGRYILSGSVRWDGSNLLGVRTNQRGTALWSGGMSWDLSKESFYNFEPLSYLRLRATYGSAGNIDRSQTHLPTVFVSTSNITGLPIASLSSAGNPSLRWEAVRTLNFGSDFRAFNNRISGSIEYYRKAGRHLLSSNSVDPTTGVPSSFKLNYAALNTWGWDVQITSRNVEKGKFSWSSSLLFNTSRNKIIDIKENPPSNDYMYIINTALYEKNTSRDRIYALPWQGLNPIDGSVLIYDKDGNISTNYQSYYLDIKKDAFIKAGLTVPPITGSIMNTFEWNGITVSALITARFGYVFRRNSQIQGGEYKGNFHTDYFKRWQQPGDEKFTNVPAATPLSAQLPTTNFETLVYTYSSELITPGDNIRLQDITFSYSLPAGLLKRMPFKQLRVYGNARTLGIIWKANDQGLDPDYAKTKYPQPKSFAAGLQVEF